MRGHSFKLHEADGSFTRKLDGLDRLAMQKQKQMLFKTNGSWADREQMVDPAGI
jgi:hypothetical protein